MILTITLCNGYDRWIEARLRAVLLGNSTPASLEYLADRDILVFNATHGGGFSYTEEGFRVRNRVYGSVFGKLED